MMLKPSDLDFSRDPDALLSALYELGREPVPALRAPLVALTGHHDPDIREEALRILGTRWKDEAVRPHVMSALESDPAPSVRSATTMSVPPPTMHSSSFIERGGATEGGRSPPRGVRSTHRTLGCHIYIGDDDIDRMDVMAHEMTHVWQYERWGAARYYARGVGERYREKTGGRPYDLPRPLSSSINGFLDYGMEQQGMVVQNCFAGSVQACILSPFQPR